MTLKTFSMRGTDYSSQKNTFEIHPEVQKYSHLAFSHSSLLFFHCDSVIKPIEGAQQGDFEPPHLVSDCIQGLIDSLVSEINLWYLDDGY